MTSMVMNVKNPNVTMNCCGVVNGMVVRVGVDGVVWLECVNGVVTCGVVMVLASGTSNGCCLAGCKRCVGCTNVLLCSVATLLDGGMDVTCRGAGEWVEWW